MSFDGIILPFIDYTAKFKNAMRNWKIPNYIEEVRRKYLEKIKRAEEMIKNKLKSVDKVWALGIKCDESDIICIVTLYLRAGPQDIFKPFGELFDILAFEERKYYEENRIKTDIKFNFPIEFKEAGCTLRTIEGNPLNLKEWYDKLNKKSFW